MCSNLTRYVLLLGLSTGYLFSTYAQAATVTELVSFNLQTTTVGFTSGQSSSFISRSLDPFDTTLGQLDAVEVSLLLGNVQSLYTTGQNFIPGPFGVPIFTPYSINTRISLDIDGVTDYFRVNPAIEGLHIVPATGVGNPFVTTGNFGLDFTIDSTSELLGNNRLPDSFGYSGGALFSIPFVSGERSDFLDTNVTSSFLLFSLGVRFDTVGTTILSTPTTITSVLNAILQVDYQYTPAPVNPIPLPAAVWMFGAGLVGLLGFTRRRRYP